MPEGPEIRRAADRVHEQLAGRRLEHVWFAFPELAPEADSLVGRRVSAVDSWGKALLTRFDDGRVLYSHNQLYGVWKLHDAEREPDTERSLRVRLMAEGRAASLYSASDVSLWEEGSLGRHPFLARLGPDLLTHGVTVEQAAARLQSAPFRRRGLGGLLLDQRLFAGVGNYLRSEILYFAGLSHKVRPEALSQPELVRLARAVLEVTHQAYTQAGVTNRDDWAKAERSRGAGFRRWRFAVFERDGLPCHACGAAIERLMVASRRLYRCPACQPDP
ncbi:endonuclease VIII [Halomonas campisalis]|uniref:DNA-(apurinic or apyrimidinic site) lyase n=1 Tax=Billgrantia campisalis TaxID=74661 RepID=A0ABS9P5M2_9GAMM|nr:endonuclease VIII [Halomonas campisalis]MCG6657078.1 endonuclease VIII [Halomonas campisalis]MDR5862263.1 endonuclease VIII [Halomonas campisalis]